MGRAEVILMIIYRNVSNAKCPVYIDDKHDKNSTSYTEMVIEQPYCRQTTTLSDKLTTGGPSKNNDKRVATRNVTTNVMMTTNVEA